MSTITQAKYKTQTGMKTVGCLFPLNTPTQVAHLHSTMGIELTELPAQHASKRNEQKKHVGKNDKLISTTNMM